MTDLAIRPSLSLESMDEFRAALRLVNDISEIRQLHDLTEAARRYAQTEEQQRAAAQAKLWTAYRGGELLAENGFGNHGGDRKSRGKLSLEDVGLAKHDSKRWQKLYAKTAEWLEEYLEASDEPTMAEALRVKDVASLLVQSKDNDWYTPSRYIESAREVLGGIDLDPASSPEANEIVGAEKFYTKDDDGLSQPWFGRVWLNPPYGRLAGGFTERLVQEYEGGEVAAAVLLVNAHCTDTSWFQPLWSHTLCFTDHRIDFESAGREKDTTSTHGSVFVYMGNEAQKFLGQFSQYGAVVRRYGES